MPKLNGYSRTCLKRSLKKNTKICFQDQLSINAGQKYCRMLQREHSAILSTFIKLLFSIKTFALYIFEWPLKTGFTVYSVTRLSRSFGPKRHLKRTSPEFCQRYTIKVIRDTVTVEIMHHSHKTVKGYTRQFYTFL